LDSYYWDSGQGIREAAKQANVPRAYPLPVPANKIMIVFTDGWQNKGPVKIHNKLD